jgi:hypothetical protein
VRRLIFAAALLAATAAAASAPASADPAAPSLEHYLSSMSWPVRASVLRARSATAAIDGWLNIGDPPFLGEIAANCRNLRAVESRGQLLQITAPPHLQPSHLRLIRAYSQAREGCRQARLTALAVRAGRRTAAAGRTRLQLLARTTLRPFPTAVGVWRSAVLDELAAVGAPSPVWLTELR